MLKTISEDLHLILKEDPAMHGAEVVIGETTEIGNDVLIYAGVLLRLIVPEKV